MIKICLDLSTACPAKCRYCLHQYKGLVKQEFMKDNVFREIMTILKRENFMFVYPYLSGEPTIHPRFWEMHTEMRVSGIQTDTATKLPVSIEYETMAGALNFPIKSARTHFDVTIDAATQETQDKISCGTMNVDTIYENLSNLVKASKKRPEVTISVITVINRFNEKEFAAIKKRVVGCGIKAWIPKPMGFYMGYMMDDTDMKNIAELAPRMGSPRFTISAGQIKSRMRDCGSFLKPVVGVHGEVTVCCHDMLYHESTANILKTGSLNSILQSYEYRKKASEGHFMRLPICKGCN